MNKPLKRALLLLVVIAAAGCLEADKKEYVKYDAKADAFVVLTTFENIRANEEKDNEGLKQLWDVREKLVLAPFTSIVIEEKGKSYRKADLGSGTLGDAAESAMDISGITIKPGVFFLSPDKTLCYFHQVTIPGKIVDGWLKDYVTPAQRENIVEEAEDEIERRGDGGKKLSPAEYAERVEKFLESNINPKKEDEPLDEKENNDVPHPFTVLDDESLKKLAADDGAALKSITREKDIFAMTLEITPEGARALKEMRVAVAETMKKYAGSDNRDAKTFFAVFANIGVDAGGGKALISIKLLNIINDMREKGETSKPDPGTRAKLDATLADVKAKGIPVREDIQIKQIVEDFMK